MNLTFLVSDSSVWPPMSCIGTLVSHGKSLMECVVVIMGDPVSATITVYLIHMSK